MGQYIAELRVQNGEYRHTHHFLLAKGSRSRANVYARQFYGDLSEVDGDSFFFNGGEVATKITSCTSISRKEFAIMSKFLDVF